MVLTVEGRWGKSRDSGPGRHWSKVGKIKHLFMSPDPGKITREAPSFFVPV